MAAARLLTLWPAHCPGIAGVDMLSSRPSSWLASWVLADKEILTRVVMFLVLRVLDEGGPSGVTKKDGSVMGERLLGYRGHGRSEARARRTGYPKGPNVS